MLGANGVHGYGYYVSLALADKAEVFFPYDNCQDVRYTLECLDELIPQVDGGFDIIHWNNGMWDCVHFLGSHDLHTPPELYEQKISELYSLFAARFPGAAICFATTTPAPPRSNGKKTYRLDSEVEDYNQRACRALSGKAEIDDLYAAGAKLGDGCRAADGTHYSEEAAKQLAEAVCAFLAPKL